MFLKIMFEEETPPAILFTLADQPIYILLPFVFITNFAKTNFSTGFGSLDVLSGASVWGLKVPITWEMCLE